MVSSTTTKPLRYKTAATGALLAMGIFSACIRSSQTDDNYSITDSLALSTKIGQAGDVAYWKIPLSATHNSDQMKLTKLALDLASDTLKNEAGKLAIAVPTTLRQTIATEGTARLTLLRNLRKKNQVYAGIVVGISNTASQATKFTLFVSVEPWMRVGFDTSTNRELSKQTRIDVSTCIAPQADLTFAAAANVLLGETEVAGFPCRDRRILNLGQASLKPLSESGTAVIIPDSIDASKQMMIYTLLTGGFDLKNRDEPKNFETISIESFVSEK